MRLVREGQIGSRFLTGCDRLRHVVLECVLTISQLLVMFDLSAEPWSDHFLSTGGDLMCFHGDILGGQTG